MKAKVVDLSKTLKGYSNKWLALDPVTMKVVVAGSDFNKVLERAWKKGVSKPVLTRAPQKYGAYIL